MPAVLNILALLACSHPDRPDARIVYGVDDPCLDELGGFPDDTEESLANEEAGCETYGGTSCDRDRFIEVDAAICIARRDGLEDGLRDLTTWLYYDRWSYNTVAWRVENWEYDYGDDFGGSLRIVHATTGEVLWAGEWEIMVE